MKTLGVDFGEKRIGLAISDEAGCFALPLKTLARTSDRQAATEIARLARDEDIAALVVGEPRGPKGAVGSAARRVATFIETLAEETGLPIETVDETLTTHEAEARLREAGLDPRARRSKIDALAAQILLQEALDRRHEASEGKGQP